MEKRTRTKDNSGDDSLELQLRQQIIHLMGGADYRPMSAADLVEALGLPDYRKRRVAELVDEMVVDGVIVRLRKKGLALAETADLLTGRISFTRSGNAFVETREPRRTLFVAAKDTGTALPGDRVMLRLKRSRKERKEGELPEAEVIRIIDWRQRTIVGTLKKMRRVYYVQPMQTQMVHDVVVSDPGKAQVGDRVLVRLEPWDDPSVSPEGEIVEVIGPADDPSLDTLAVAKAYELPDVFPDAALQQAERAEVKEDDLSGRLDLRKTFVFTIDPETAKDFDDAISLERTRSGNWQLGVHIADVAQFVTPGSQLDNSAFERGTSVYLPDKVIPMLPEQLSNGLCSLKEGVDRLTFSAMITLDDEANVIRVAFRESIICSRKRLTYAQALRLLQLADEQAAAELDLPLRQTAKIRQVHLLAQKLRHRRIEEGALMLDIPEVKFRIGSDGRIAEVVPVENDISHQLIEECMLLANEQVARHLAGCGFTQLHRIHAHPDPESLAELQSMFQAAGVQTGDLSLRQNLSNLILQIRDLAPAHAWYTSILRSMKRAEYSIEPVGHYGLAKEHYAHFTSPIRRYPDLITHRLMKATLVNAQTPYGKKALDRIAVHSSEREQIAAEAERDITDLKIIRFFAEQLEFNDVRRYDAVVVDVRNNGAFIDLPQVRASGLIHVSELANDFYDFDPVRSELRGRRSGIVISVGCRLVVVISRVNQEKKFLDFSPVNLHELEPAKTVPPREKQRSKDSSKRGKRSRRR